MSERTELTRLRHRQVTDRRVLHEVLDAGLVAHVAVCDAGSPVVLPVGYARDGERLLLHGSTGAGLLRTAAAGAPVSVCVTLFDGLVYARTLFDSSMNYRSVVVFGQATEITGAAKTPALQLISERLMPGRWAEVREPTERELAATMVLALPLTEVSVKVRTGPPSDDEPTDRVWAGVLPVHTVAGEPVAASDVAPGIAVPPSIGRAARRVAELSPPS